MKRRLTLVLCAALGALALGCTVESADPIDEQAGEQTEGLLEDEEATPTTDRGLSSNSGLTKGAEPNGPSPYPWRPKVYDEDPNGPSPYPWKGTSGSGSGNTGDDTGDDETGSSKQGTSTSGY